ncbi:FadR/GntR family transcriptional regulator [Devosia sp. SL43]|jgi:GntR family transcriptional repressor for pyruvate dehydrogenase complex|uniref:FadR/GntR family transcriptional regulator n=1 Tax=Devosia sp. SL43 TaxID=2806348 RepID=UPI001F1B739B|nr:FadR/GntR family transcriptional regulator [Devosia sp. SL43]UJW84003.1 FadR family transcriptional regulator [Devosia sp. SL43]
METMPTRRRERLAQAVIDELKRQIQTGALSIGDRLPTEPQLEAQFDVSRTVVREAIADLRAAGLVTPIQGKGMFVTDSPASALLTPTEVQSIPQTLEMIEFRIAVETEAAAIAAYRRSAQQEADIRLANQTLAARIAAREATIDADFAFHEAIARAANNRHFIDALHRFGSRSIPRSQFPTLPDAEGSDYLTKVLNEHEAILEAISDQDPEAARAAMRDHLTSSQKRYRRLAR